MHFLFRRVEPRVEPVNGVVQPPVIPPAHRPGRLTNQLAYIRNTVMRAVFKHQHSWPFTVPVDTVKFNLPDYFKIVEYPMDLGTVRKRLENNYYWCARECMDDVQLIFKNCYRYNKPGEDVTLMGQSLEKLFLNKMKSMPPVEAVMPGEKKKAKPNVTKAKKMVPPGGGISTGSGIGSPDSPPAVVDPGPDIKVKVEPKAVGGKAAVLPDGSMLTPAKPATDTKPPTADMK